MTTPLFLLLVLILTGEGFYLGLHLMFSWRRTRRDILLFLVIVANFVVSLVPAYYVLITGHFDAFSFGYELSTWTLGLELEALFFAVFIMALGIKRTSPLMEAFARSLRHTPSSTGYLFLMLIVSGACYCLLWGPWTGAGYEAAGDYIKKSLNSPDVTVGGIQNTFLLAVVMPLICVLLFYVPRRQVPFWLLVPLWGLFLYLAAEALASGGRGGVLEVALAAASCRIAAGSRIKAVAYVLGAILFLLVFTSAIVGFRGQAERYAHTPVWEKLERTWDYRESEPLNFLSVDWADTYLRRLDSIQNGGILAMRTQESQGFAYLRPFAGALSGLIPRYFWKNKPVPLSDNGVVSGLPWYLVMAYRGEPYNNGGVSTSGIAYWQFGIIGVFLTALMGAFVFRMLSSLFIHGGAVGLFFFLSFCMMTHFRIPVGMDETLFVAGQVVLPLLVAFGVFRFVTGIAHRDANRTVSFDPVPYFLQVKP
jgi:hypothetical protein